MDTHGHYILRLTLLLVLLAVCLPAFGQAQIAPPIVIDSAPTAGASCAGYSKSIIYVVSNDGAPDGGELWACDRATTQWVMLSSGGVIAVPGSDTELIFNDSGSLGASSNLTTDGTNLTVNGTITLPNGTPLILEDAGGAGVDALLVTGADVLEIGNDSDLASVSIGETTIETTIMGPETHLSGGLTLDTVGKTITMQNGSGADAQILQIIGTELLLGPDQTDLDIVQVGRDAGNVDVEIPSVASCESDTQKIEADENGKLTCGTVPATDPPVGTAGEVQFSDGASGHDSSTNFTFLGGNLTFGPGSAADTSLVFDTDPDQDITWDNTESKFSISSELFFQSNNDWLIGIEADSGTLVRMVGIGSDDWLHLGDWPDVGNPAPITGIYIGANTGSQSTNECVGGSEAGSSCQFDSDCDGGGTCRSNDVPIHTRSNDVRVGTNDVGECHTLTWMTGGASAGNGDYPRLVYDDTNNDGASKFEFDFDGVYCIEPDNDAVDGREVGINPYGIHIGMDCLFDGSTYTCSGLGGSVSFEGATLDVNETNLRAVDPTHDDNNLLLPDTSSAYIVAAQHNTTEPAAEYCNEIDNLGQLWYHSDANPDELYMCMEETGTPTYGWTLVATAGVDNVEADAPPPKCITVEALADADDNKMFWAPDVPVTLQTGYCYCSGSCSTEAQITFETYQIGTASTVDDVGGTITCQQLSDSNSATTLTSDNTVDALDVIRFDVDAAPDPDGEDDYLICITYTVD